MEKLKINVNTKGSGKSKLTSLLMSGCACIQQLEAALPQVKAIFDESQHLHLELKQLTGIDLTAIQLIESMRHSADSRKTKFTYKMELTAEMQKLLTRAGLQHFLQS